uniref:Uncharacterized protein n=1 Tax=Physcomitrium patens TaxID=3218 RepID=A0A2K1IS13_PHYPA|nr:hypothetical protein PHYPA_026173 [Physcomitrium patens]
MSENQRNVTPELYHLGYKFCRVKHFSYRQLKAFGTCSGAGDLEYAPSGFRGEGLLHREVRKRADLLIYCCCCCEHNHTEEL